MDKNLRRQRFLLSGSLLFIIIACLLHLGYTACIDSNSDFVNTSSQSPWIQYPLAMDSIGRSGAMVDLKANFEKEFTLNEVPSAVKFHIKPFRTAVVYLNGRKIYRQNNTPKQSVCIDVTDILKDGHNVISAEVIAHKGNPMLQLYSEGLSEEIPTDRTWHVSLHHGPKTDARIADDTQSHPLSKIPPGPIESMHKHLLLWIGVFGLAAGIMIIASKKQFLTVPKVSRTILIVVLIIWAIVFWHNARHIPLATGFDGQAHLDYIDYLMTQGQLPTAEQLWQGYQPPLYYVLSTALLSIGKSLDSQTAINMSLRFIGFLSGLGQIIVGFYAAKLFWPQDRSKQTLALVLTSLIPVNLYLSGYVSNEPLNAMLMAGVIILFLYHIHRQQLRLKNGLWIGLIWGLALLTKFTALLLLPPILLVLIIQWVISRIPQKQVTQYTIGFLGVAALLAGWFYIRNVVSFGTVLAGNWSDLPGMQWWQDPGFRSISFFSRFSTALTRPYFTGFHSFWDSLYGTFWTDGLLSGSAVFTAAPAWHYSIIGIIPVLAIPVMLFMMIGLFKAIHTICSKADLRWLFILLVLAMGIYGLIYMNLNIASYAQAKSFYALFALMCIVLLSIEGFGTVIQLLKRFKAASLLNALLCGWMAILAVAVFAGFWAKSDKIFYRKDLATVSAQGNLDSLIADFEQYLESNSKDYEACYTLASAYMIKQDYANARQYFGQALEIRPNWPQANNNLAYLLAMNIQDYPQAIEHARKACYATGYLNINFLDTLMKCYSMADQKDMAFQTAERMMDVADLTGQSNLKTQIRQMMNNL